MALRVDGVTIPDPLFGEFLSRQVQRFGELQKGIFRDFEDMLAIAVAKKDE